MAQISNLQSPIDLTPASGNYILIVDDNPADVHLTEMALTTQFPDVRFEVVRDGQQAIEFFAEADKNESVQCPALVILDLNLPRYNGTTVLRQMRKTKKCEHAPVLVATTSKFEKDRAEMLAIGANGFFTKPSQYSEYMKLGVVARAILESSGIQRG